MGPRLPKLLTKHSRAYWAAVLLSSIVLVAPTASVAAISADGIGVYPTGKRDSSTPWFVYHLASGQRMSDSLTISNTSSQTQELLVYPVDAVLTSGGGFGMLPASSPKIDVGSWVGLAKQQLKIAAHAQVVVGFTFAVPLDTPVGAHYGGIIVEPTQSRPAQTTKGLNVRVISRLGIRIYETVPGVQHPALSLEKFKTLRTNGILSFVATLRNSGNTALSPTGSVTVHNLVGRMATSQPLAMSRLLQPNQVITATFKVPVPTTVPQRYVAKLNIRYANDASLVRSTAVWTQVQILFGLVLLAGCILVASFVTKKLRHPKN